MVTNGEIQDFKEIEERKGYLVEKEDRKIFQRNIKHQLWSWMYRYD